MVNAVIGQIQGERKAAKGGGRTITNCETLVLAPYLATPTAKSFIDAGISFADEVGNIHLALGDEYNWTVIGERKPPKPPHSERLTPAAVQLMFQFATTPESVNWTVRDLAAVVGLSKSKVAELRLQSAQERIFKAQGTEQSPDATRELTDRLVSGYNQILRPKLVLGRFRYQEPSVEQFVARLTHDAAAQKIPYALTGGPAADAMQHFYRSSEVPVSRLSLRPQPPPFEISSTARRNPDRQNSASRHEGRAPKPALTSVRHSNVVDVADFR